MKVKVIKNFYDKVKSKLRRVGEILEEDETRAKLIVERGCGKLIEDIKGNKEVEKPVKKETKKKK